MKTALKVLGALVLIQTKKISDFPVILYGSEYWAGLIDWMRKTVLAANNIAAEDVDSIHLVDQPEAVRDIVVEYYRKARV